ncbi:Uncharacterised protein [Acinetobacter baumannii]|nr:Uncharacterised protein [Acinetobacter baumannii]
MKSSFSTRDWPTRRSSKPAMSRRLSTVASGKREVSKKLSFIRSSRRARPLSRVPSGTTMRATPCLSIWPLRRSKRCTSAIFARFTETKLIRE